MAPRRVTITVKSIMQDVAEVLSFFFFKSEGMQTRVQVLTTFTVADLRATLASAGLTNIEGHSFLFNGRELTDEKTRLCDYGINDDASISLQPKLHSVREKAEEGQDLQGKATGSMTATSTMLLQMPRSFPEKSNVLRTWIADIPHKKSRSPGKETLGKKNKVTPVTDETSSEKQREHEKTRARMQVSPSSPSLKSSKMLLVQRKLFKGVHHREREPDTGSVPGSPAIGSPTRRSPERRAMAAAYEDGADRPFSDSELRAYFDPPESEQEQLARRRDFYDPPRNREELEEIRCELKEKAEHHCHICRHHLSLGELDLHCL